MSVKANLKRLGILLAAGMMALPLGTFGLAPSDSQSDTLKELIEVIEERHYASRRYDDALSAQHFVAYLDALDPPTHVLCCRRYRGVYAMEARVG